MLHAGRLSYATRGCTLLADVELQLAAGEVLAVLGPNGAGKSTLLRLLARELLPSGGDIELDGRPIGAWSAVELARRRAVLPQAEGLRFGFTVREVVRLGRFPWGPLHEARIVDAALALAGMTRLATRAYPSLSAGERARAQLARVFAQVWPDDRPGARYLLLDEPTASLDLSQQHAVLAAVRRFAHGGVGVLLVVHDLNLALHYADRVMLLKDGRVYAQGPARTTLGEQVIRDVFDVDVERVERPGSDLPWIVPRGTRAVETPDMLGYTARPFEGL